MVKTIVYPVLLILVFSLIVYKEKRVNQNFQINKILEEFKSPVRLYSITIIIASIILIKLGTQQGAWLSYYFQLLFPTLTIFSVTCLYNFYCKCNNSLVLLITCFCCLIWSIFTIDISCTYLSENEKEDWYKVENMINTYIEDNRNIYLSCLVSPIAILKDQSVESNGHDYVANVDNHIISKVMKIDNIETIYPALVNMYEYAYNWNLKRNNKFEYGEYSLIICDEMKKDYVDKLNYYVLTDSVNLHAGQQKWMHYIYKKIEE
jgi:Ca2+/Na+ antiporter